jgi:hypothetical protein
MQLTPLNFAEAEWLKDCEYDIENGLVVFLKVGQRLMEIRANRLYRATHATFEDYCLERWNISRPRVYQLMAAAETSENCLQL